MIVSAARVLVDGALRPGAVRVEAGRIATVLDEPAGEGTLTPGLVDIHSNGAFGVDFARADVPAFRRAAAPVLPRS